MKLQQYLLTKLAEENVEIAHIALKAQQFGFLDKCPEQPFTNAERMHQELDDLWAIVEMLNDIGFNYTPNRERIEKKKEKVYKYLDYSKSLGMVENNDN